MKKYLLLIISIMLTGQLLLGQSGQLDPSFAVGGIFNEDLDGHDIPQAIDLQEDGKMVFILSKDFQGSPNFDIAVVRLNEDGTLDDTFADGGIYHYSNPVASDLGYDIKVLDDGKILAAGSHGTSGGDPDFLLFKLNADGTPDTSFGTDGVMIQPVGPSQDYIRCIAISPEGQIIAGGHHSPSTTLEERSIVARFNADGSLDTTFGEDGFFIWNEEGYNQIYDIDFSDDGSIYACGKSSPAGTDRLALYKIRDGGSSLEPGFADNGEMLAPWEGKAHDMIVHSNGNIIIAGYASNMSGSNVIAMAFDGTGNPVADFGMDGIFFFDLDDYDVSRALIEQVDGKIILAGQSGGSHFTGGAPGAPLTVRIDENGMIDETWGDMGYVTTPIEETIGAIANDVIIQPDGKVVIAGQQGAITGNDMIAIRYGNFIDVDQDGFGLEEDCNDNNFDINPGADEVAYNGLDDDCNAETPDDDIDGDGFVLEDDCDDTNADINPDATEIPGNDVDEDCDGLVVGVNETELAQKFNVYPSPTRNMVYIDFYLETPDIDFIEVNDYTGRKVRTIKVTQNTTKVAIPLDGLPQGLWMLTIHTSEGIAVKRVIKE
jgi:uncharacterized delta-60 repeat protein